MTNQALVQRAIIAEFMGSFVFFSIIVIAIHKYDSLKCSIPIAISFGYLAGLLIATPLSGGHLNPAVSIMSILYDPLNSSKYCLYILAQLLAAVLVVFFVRGWYLNVQH